MYCIKKMGIVALMSTTSILSFAEGNQIQDENLLDAVTISVGSHTAAQNAAHQRICGLTGAIDVTDTWNFKTTQYVTDVVVCTKAATNTEALAGAFSGDLFNSVMNNNLHNLSVIGPNGNVPKGPYWIKGTATYTGARIGAGIAVEVGVPLDNCQIRGGGTITIPDGQSYIQTTCSYPSGKNPTPTYANAVLEGVSANFRGSLNHQ